MPRIKDEYAKRVKAAKPIEITEIKPQASKSSDGIVVEGVDNCLIKLAKCCAPLPGDEIIGFITRGHGVSVHKRDCNNVPREIENSEEPDRWIPAHWSNSHNENFVSTLQVYSIDRDGVLIDVMTAIQNMRVPVHSVNARPIRSGNCIITLTISAESVEHLRSIIAKIEKVKGIFNEERINQ